MEGKTQRMEEWRNEEWEVEKEGTVGGKEGRKEAKKEDREEEGGRRRGTRVFMVT